MASRKREQGPTCVTHRPRGRLTIVSPQNARVTVTPRTRTSGGAHCLVCGGNKHRKTKSKNWICVACEERGVITIRPKKKAGSVR